MQLSSIKTPPFQLQKENASTQKIEEYTEKIQNYIINYNEAIHENSNPEKYTEQLYTQEYTNQLNHFIHRNWITVLGHTLASEPEWYPEIHPSTTTDPDNLETKFPLPVQNMSFSISSDKGILNIAVYLHEMNKPLTFTIHNSYFIDIEKYITLDQLTYNPKNHNFQAKFFIQNKKEEDDNHPQKHFPETPETENEAIDILENNLDEKNFLTLVTLLEGERDTIYFSNQTPIEPITKQAIEYIDENIKLIRDKKGLWVTKNIHNATTIQIDIHTSIKTQLYKDHLTQIPAPVLDKKTAQTKRFNLRRRLVSLLSNNIIERESISLLTLLQYIPEPTYKGIINAIQEGKQITTIAEKFDKKHNCTHAQDSIQLLKNRYEDSIKPQT